MIVHADELRALAWGYDYLSLSLLKCVIPIVTVSVISTTHVNINIVLIIYAHELPALARLGR